jgi:glycosyltransferase involved in cell wall biosynthesis
VNKGLLIVTNNAPGVIDGVSDFSFGLLRSLRGKNVEAFIACKKSSTKNLSIAENSFSEFVYPSVDKWGFKSALEIKSIAKKKEVEYVFLQYVPYSYSNAGLPFHLIFLFLLLRLNGIKTAIFFHEIAIDPNESSFINIIRSLLQRICAWKLCFLSNHVLTSTEKYQSMLRPFKSAVQPVPSNFESIYNNEGVLQNESNSNDIIVSSFLNRCNLTLLETIEQLKKEHLNIKLSLIGKTVESHVLFVKKNVKAMKMDSYVLLHEERKPADILKILSDSGIYIQLEKISAKGAGGASGKSGALATAMMLGLPVISTKGNLTDAFFSANKNIVFVEPGNVASIKMQIKKLIEEASFRKQLGGNAKSTYLLHSSWRIVAENIIHQFDLAA